MDVVVDRSVETREDSALRTHERAAARLHVEVSGVEIDGAT